MRVQAIGAVLVGALIGLAQAQERVPAREWRYFGGDKAFTRYSPLDQITRDNVKNLRIVWRRPAVNDELIQAFPDLRATNYLRSTPIVIDGLLYTQNAHGLVVAIDGESGKTVWEQELFARTREEANGAATRGLDYWRGGAGNADKRIFAIRADRAIGAPDAIQLACAASAGVDLFITNDDRLSRKHVPDVKFITSLERAYL